MAVTFDNILGQPHAKAFLNRAFAHRRISHAYLFVGAEGTGKAAMALEFAKALLCTGTEKGSQPCQQCVDCRHIAELNHQNLVFWFPHPKSAKEADLQAVRASMIEQPYAFKKPWPNAAISIDTVRGLKRELGLKSHQGRSRVIVITDAHCMTAEATNSLLKILEEPPEQTYFVLTSDRSDQLLPTVISRCQMLRFNQIGVADLEDGLRVIDGHDDTLKRQAARLANGSMRRALELLDEDMLALNGHAVELMRATFKSPSQSAIFALELAQKYDKASIQQILENLLLWLRDALLILNLDAEQAKAHVTNENEMETITRFVERAPLFDFQQAIREIEISVEMINRYVQPGLVLTVMLNKLRQFVQAHPAQHAA